jgi:hypothetical protein
VVPALLVGFVVVGIAGGLLARDALEARRGLNEARSAIAAATSAMVDGDLAQAGEHIGAAEEAVARSDNRTDGMLWSAAGYAPLAGRSPRTLRAVVDVAGASVEVIDAALIRLGELVGPGGELEMRIDEGQVDLVGLETAARAMRDLPVESLRAAYERLVDLPTTWIPPQVREGRMEALDLGERALRGLDAARDTSSMLPAYLGAEGRRQYFVGMQTPAELRATGGLLGFYSIVTVEDGRISVGEPIVLDDEADEGPPEAASEDEEIALRLGQVGRERGFVVPAPEDYQARYEHVSAGGHFSNVNVDPHLPLASDVLLALYEHHTEQRLDGVILLDPIALGTLLEPIGPVEVDGTLLDAGGRLPAEVAPEEVADLLTHDIYEVYGREHREERRAFFRDFASRSFDAVFAGTWEGVDFVRGIGEAAGGRHLQMFSAHADEQAAFHGLGVAGAFGREAETGDLLAMTANNAVGGKMDVHLGHRFSGDLRIDLEPARRPDQRRAIREGSVRVAVDNPLPAEGMDLYIIGNCTLGEGGGCFEGPPGVNRTWFTVWTPETTRLVEARDSGGVTHAWSGELHGLRTHDRYLETEPESDAWFELDLSGDVTLVRDGHELVYRLTWWRQSKAIPDLLDLTVRAPDGWHVNGATIDGGDGRAAMGVHGGAEPVDVEVTDGRARVHGAAASDVEVEIRFGRPFWQRTWDWWQEPVF